MHFTLAIVGRPNVGKSTLFNRLIGRRLALVDDLPGVTRDRREGEARLGDLEFTAIDTAGLEEAKSDSLAGRMMTQTRRAVAEADAVLFLIDARVGITPADKAFAELVRRSGKPAIVVANKSEGAAGAAGGRRRRVLPSRISSGRASRSPYRPSTARDWPTSTTRCAPRCPRRRRNPVRTRQTRRSNRAARSESRSSVDPTPASRLWSTG